MNGGTSLAEPASLPLSHKRSLPHLLHPKDKDRGRDAERVGAEDPRQSCRAKSQGVVTGLGSFIFRRSFHEVWLDEVW